MTGSIIRFLQATITFFAHLYAGKILCCPMLIFLKLLFSPGLPTCVLRPRSFVVRKLMSNNSEPEQLVHHHATGEGIGLNQIKDSAEANVYRTGHAFILPSRCCAGDDHRDVSDIYWDAAPVDMNAPPRAKLKSFSLFIEKFRVRIPVLRHSNLIGTMRSTSSRSDSAWHVRSISA